MNPTGNGGPRKRASGYHRVTSDEVAEMVRLYEQGMTITAIAERLGRSTATIAKRLERAGARARTRTHLTEAEQAFIAKHARDGWAAPAIAEAMGRDPATVRACLVSGGYSYVPHPGRVRAPRLTDDVGAIRVPDEVRARVPSVARRAANLAAAARELDLNPGTAERVLRVDAPVVLHRLGKGTRPGEVIANTAGDFARTERNLRDGGLARAGDYNTLVDDYGPDTVRDWIEQLTASRDAMKRVRYQLRLALERHEARQARAGR